MRFADAIELNWDGRYWTGALRLPSWSGFQARYGAYGSVSSTTPSDGTVTLVLGPEGRGAEPPRQDEAEAFRWLLNNEVEVQNSILRHLLGQYPSLQEMYGYSGDEALQLMPSVNDQNEFRALIGLHSVYIHPLTRGGLPYLGFELGCTWDDEHGLGFMMHGHRVVDLGGADTAFTLWIAKKDAKEA